MTKVDEIWKKMNKSEKFGCQFALFPKWVQEYELTHEEIVELMGMKENHSLTIHSLSDAQASCLCGWHYAFTGSLTRNQVEAEYFKHLGRNREKLKAPEIKKQSTSWYGYDQ